LTAHFFIVGCARSGTTLLQRMLNTHSEIAVTPESHFGPRHVGRRRAASVRAEPSARAAVLDAFLASPAFERMGLDEAVVRERAMSHLEDPWFPLRVAMDEFGRVRNATTVGEKTPGHALHVEALAQAFPEARFLFVRRDPRAVVASWDRVVWSQRSAVEVAEIWQRYAKTLRLASRRLAGRHLEICYEELVTKTETVLRSTCAFLEVEFESAMLDYHRRAIDAKSGHGPSHALIAEPPLPARIDAWRTELGRDEQLRVETVCGREMTRMGYAPDARWLDRFRTGLHVLPPLWPRRLKRSLRGG
jgi:hypothetical protein